jgi:hypothetical protein
MNAAARMAERDVVAGRGDLLREGRGREGEGALREGFTAARRGAPDPPAASIVKTAPRRGALPVGRSSTTS